MAYLLDTHTLVWWWLADPKLSDAARAIVSDRSQQVMISAATAYEIANKVRLGKWPAVRSILDAYDSAVSQDGFVGLPVNSRHAHRAGLLGGEHRDPFDRLIAAQALLEDLTVVTRDPEIAAFGCKVLW